MMNSVPIEVAKLGLDCRDYYDGISKNVNRVLNMRDKWESIIKRANLELPKWVRDIGTKLPKAMSYDRRFFRAAGLDYSLGPPVQGCFTVAVADYLLRNQNRLKETAYN